MILQRTPLSLDTQTGCNAGYQEEDDGEGSGSARYKSYHVPVGSMDCVTSDVIHDTATTGSYVIRAENETDVCVPIPSEFEVRRNVPDEQHLSEDTGNSSGDVVAERLSSHPPETLWDGDRSESTDAHPHQVVIPMPPPLPSEPAATMQKAKSTGTILRPKSQRKRLSRGHKEKAGGQPGDPYI